MHYPNDSSNFFNDPLIESGDSLLPFSEQPFQVTGVLITPEIRITQPNSTNVDGSGVFRCPEVYAGSSPLMGDTMVAKNRDDSFLSVNDSCLNSINDFNFPNSGQIFQPLFMPFPQSNTMSQPTQKLIEIDYKNEIPSDFPFTFTQYPVIPLSAQPDSSSMLFPDQRSVLPAGDHYAPSGLNLVIPRRNSPPQMITSGLTTPGFVTSPSPLSATWTDEGINGDLFDHVNHSTPDCERNKRRYIFSSQSN